MSVEEFLDYQSRTILKEIKYVAQDALILQPIAHGHWVLVLWNWTLTTDLDHNDYCI